MTSRNIAISLLLAILLAALWGNNQNQRIESRLDALEGEMQWCVWHHDNHDTKLIKGTKVAEKFRRDHGKPSDEGDC